MGEIIGTVCNLESSLGHTIGYAEETSGSSEDRSGLSVLNQGRRDGNGSEMVNKPLSTEDGGVETTCPADEFCDLIYHFIFWAQLPHL